jgi:PAS domain S-box-containing protein
MSGSETLERSDHPEAHSALLEERREKDRLRQELEKGETQFATVITASMDAMVAIDREGLITVFNPAAEKMFGWKREEVLGGPLDRLMPEEYREKHRHYIESYYTTGEPHNAIGHIVELPAVHRTGRPFVIELALSASHLNDEPFVLAVIRDVTARRRAEETLKASLKEKEVLLQEIHHRVKNNLQIVSSLLNLQINKLEDETVRDAFLDVKQRVTSMAMVHEQLYRSKDLSGINFGQYIRQLASEMYQVYAADPAKWTLTIRAGDVILDIDTAIPCSLILTELLSNVLKYAFPDGRPGEIHIDFDADGLGTINLVVADNGVGLPEGLLLENADSLGLQLVTSLVKQLNGDVRVNCDNGVEWEIDFPFAKPEELSDGKNHRTNR